MEQSSETLGRQELAAYRALIESGNLLQLHVNRQLRRDHGITQAQFEILARVVFSPDGVGMTELAEQSVVSKSGMTYRVAQLEKAGLLQRTTDSRDERSVIARPTSAGRALIAAALPAHVALVRELFFSVLGPEDVEALVGILQRVAGRLRQASTDLLEE